MVELTVLRAILDGISPGILTGHLTVWLLIYFVPTFIALLWRGPFWGWAVAVNLLAGWSVIGWFASVLLAVQPGTTARALLSTDGNWWWNGRTWKPTLSPDGRWRWTGTGWQPFPASIGAPAEEVTAG